MRIDTSKRSDAPEIMDDFNLEGEILRDALDKIAHINRLLGGNKVTLQGLKWLLKAKAHGHTTITILDVGCGNGDMLRVLADYALKNQLDFKLIGIDANKFTVKHAQQLSTAYANISYRCVDIFEEIKQDEIYDVILCTLTLHHFRDDEIRTLMNGFKKQSALGIVVNDLHRSALACYLFLALCFVFRLNHMSREDGLVSILRGFKKSELETLSQELNINSYLLKWKWAFRYQWIINTI
ncbi:methyltransferase domain-containing protein [Pedobacter nyackensis]|uniref:Methyltransferase domain-containing protein n=1 Tax=Pedobacter nyackensis TaxID=475255 RepID=A0A1W2EWV7_9SPHI|nr:methyltransferase domain-containing protein [Pedobacter nyackensis]SMD14184.1 Methyltransferase domain-containing protein [Pedobacter nyackensis]